MRAVILAVAICLFASLHAHAQPLFPHDQSIECTVANADLVFIAKLVKFGDAKRADDGGRDVHLATIDVEETLKQDLFTIDPYKRMSLDLRGPASVLADWTKRSCKLLITLESNAPQATKAIELTEGKLDVWKADLTLLRKPDDVIKAAKEALKRMPASVKRIHTFGLKVPRDLVADTQWEKYYHTGGHLVLSVPVDGQLEKRALDYVRSKDDSNRAEGARALRYFKSDENIARVKALLNDPARALRHHAEESKGMEAIYFVRYAAYETLRVWEVDVAKPVLREDNRCWSEQQCCVRCNSIDGNAHNWHHNSATGRPPSICRSSAAPAGAASALSAVTPYTLTHFSYGNED
jgi:hypothetical protein